MSDKPLSTSERLHKLASDIQFGAGLGEARFHQGALLRAIADAEVSALEQRAEQAERRLQEALAEPTTEEIVAVATRRPDGIKRADPADVIAARRSRLAATEEDK